LLSVADAPQWVWYHSHSEVGLGTPGRYFPKEPGMTLDLADGKLFFELMWKLQYYVNQKRGFHKSISSAEEYTKLSTEKKLKAREALWENTELIEAFVHEDDFP
jgi:hypothetical protein